jgi:hypothetical protein
MIYIDNEDFITLFLEEWLKDSDSAIYSMIYMTDSGRKSFIENNSSIWNKYKKTLWMSGSKKCWYTEKKISLKESVIEHFRPKGKIYGIKKPLPTHNGYWWLAFYWKNFRISFSLPNLRLTDFRTEETTGKSSFFPLIQEGFRNYNLTYDIKYKKICMDCLKEEPLLLDPTNPDDCKLITFNDEGKVNYPIKTNSNNRLDSTEPNSNNRLDSTIKLYSLNDGVLIDERRMKWAQIKKEVDEIENLLQTDPGNKIKMKKHRNEILRLINHQSEYSSTALHALKIEATLFNWHDLI